MRSRRAVLLLGLAPLLLGSGDAYALEPPSGKVVLTLTGRLERRNAPDGALFDMALLEKLPQHSFWTKTPWFPRPRKFTGVLLRDLLAAVGAAPTRLRASALNDYRVDIPAEDVNGAGVLLAYRLDDQPMSVREKGPLLIVYPFDQRPELRSPVHYGRAIWQLRAIELQ